jgi:hypothetical protein
MGTTLAEVMLAVEKRKHSKTAATSIGRESKDAPRLTSRSRRTRQKAARCSPLVVRLSTRTIPHIDLKSTPFPIRCLLTSWA